MSPLQNPIVQTKRTISKIALSALLLIMLSPSANADHEPGHPSLFEDATEEEIRAVESAERICAGLEGAEYSNCIDSAGQNYLDATETDASEDYQTGPEEDIQDDFADLPLRDVEGNVITEDGAGSGASSRQAIMPSIPKPDFLPGPSETASADEIQHYIRNRAIPNFTGGLIGLLGGLSMIALVWAGIRFASSQGEEEAITNAKKTATWAVIGFGIALLSYAIVSIIATISYPDPENSSTEQEDIIYDRI